jgi:hypothetical protein
MVFSQKELLELVEIYASYERPQDTPKMELPDDVISIVSAFAKPSPYPIAYKKMMEAMERDDWPELKTMLRGPAADQALVYINGYLKAQERVAAAYHARLEYEATMSIWPEPEEWAKHDELCKTYARCTKYEHRIMTELVVVTTPLEEFM